MSIGAAAVLLGAVVSIAAAARNDAFVMGVLRRDGVVVPFATWDGKRWRSDWPAPEQDPDVPISLASVPLRWWGRAQPDASWQVWTRQPTPHPVRVRQPDWFKAQCLRQIGLRTDYRPAELPPPPDVHPYPKDGLALSAMEPVSPILVLPSGQPTRVMIDAFEDSEAALLRGIGRSPPGVSHDEDERARIPLTVEAEYAFDGAASTRYYYVEMSREYGHDRGDRSCSAVVFGAGWFARDPDGMHPLGFDVSLADCDRYGLAYMLPLGALRLNGRIYWVGQWSGWDFERYTIVELTPKKARQVLSVYGGGC